jgi:hypothetical protein
MTEDEIKFVERFIRNWREECKAKGLPCESAGSPDSNIRMLARTIAKTVFRLNDREKANDTDRQ